MHFFFQGHSLWPDSSCGGRVEEGDRRGERRQKKEGGEREGGERRGGEEKEGEREEGDKGGRVKESSHVF